MIRRDGWSEAAAATERAAIEDAYRAMQEIGPLVDRLNDLEEEEASIARMLEAFATVLERRVVCRRCGARVVGTSIICRTCGRPLRRGLTAARGDQDLNASRLPDS